MENRWIALLLLVGLSCGKGREAPAPSPQTSPTPEPVAAEAAPTEQPEPPEPAPADAPATVEPDEEPAPSQPAVAELELDDPGIVVHYPKSDDDTPPSIDVAWATQSKPLPPAISTETIEEHWTTLGEFESASLPFHGALVRTDRGDFRPAESGGLEEVRGLGDGFRTPYDHEDPPAPEASGETEMGVDLRMVVDSNRLEGWYPDNVWHVAYLSDDRRGNQTVLRQWAAGQWVVPKIRSDPDNDALEVRANTISVLDGPLVHRATARGGFVLAHSTYDPIAFEFYRVGSRRGRPVWPAHVPTGHLHDFVETKTGALFVFFQHEDDGSLNIGRSCRKGKPDCGYPPRFVWSANTDNRDWQVRPVPRGHYSMSVEVRNGPDDPKSHALIHFGHGGWRVEALPSDGTVSEMHPDGASGLWLLMQTRGDKGGPALWHRSPQGTWTRRSLPAKSRRASDVSITAGAEGRLWMVVRSKKRATLHALTPGKAPT